MKQQIYEQQIQILLKIIFRMYTADHLSDQERKDYETIAFYHQEHKGA